MEQETKISYLQAELDRKNNDAKKFDRAIEQIRREKQVNRDLKQENKLLTNTLAIVEKTMNQLTAERDKLRTEN